jgi:signal transduction histidine kinase
LEQDNHNVSLELARRKQVEEALRKAHDELERRVEERTAELFQANATLVREMAERKQLEEQLHQAQKMEALGRLTGGIAHDFNNLLTAIIGFAELIRLNLSSGDSLEELVDKIVQPARRAAELVSQLLAFSRKQIIEPQILDLNIIVAKVDKMLQPIIGENIELKILLKPALWSIKADPIQLEQVLLNLVVNARDAMPEGGKLTLETNNVILNENYTVGHLGVQPGNYVLLVVSDTGIGMSEAVKSHIFEPFFTTKEEGHGTGLGLATVYGIVRQSGGDIWVYSEEGQGTTFKIYLPSVEEAAQPLAPLEDGTEAPNGHETVLLVEDDPDVRDLTRRVLQGQGYILLEAQNAQEALLLSSRYSGFIHLVLTDVIMPGMNGKTLAERLNQSQPRLKVLFMSGYTDNMIAQHGVLEPGIAFLQKPFGPTILARKVREVLDS